jgi:hypothetical protein
MWLLAMTWGPWWALAQPALPGGPLPALVVESGAAHADTQRILDAVRKQQAEGKQQRSRWVFQQQVLVRMLRGKGALAREELRQYRVRPTEKSIERDLLSLEGKVAIKGKVYPYSDPEYRTGGLDLDGEIAQSFAEDIMFHKDGDDSLEDSMYPLSNAMMARHQFSFQGEERYQGREVYRFTFQPNPKQGKKPGQGKDNESSRETEELQRGFWEGEMLVDRATLAPVLVVTHQARNLPLVVRTLLGSNVKQFGYKLEYAQMPDGTWFPSRYSGEFSLRVLFGYSRRIAVSALNSDFQRASADTEIRYDLDAPVEESDGTPHTTTTSADAAPGAPVLEESDEAPINR